MQATSNETPNYTQMGIASLIPGAQYILTRVEGLVEELRAMLEAAKLEAAGTAGLVVGRRNGASKRGKRAKAGYWASMTPEERSAEVKRRMAKSKKAAKATKATGEPRHPSDPRHPRHEQWIENLRASQRRYQARKARAAKRAESAVAA